MNRYTFHPRFSLAALKVSDFASEETLCFQASILLDGKKVGTASNDGHGGCHLIRFTDKGAETLFGEEAAKLPAWKYDDGTTIERGTEGFIDWLVAEAEMRKHAKKYVTYLPEGETEPGDFGYLKSGRKKAPAGNASAIAYLEKNSPGVTLVVA